MRIATLVLLFATGVTGFAPAQPASDLWPVWETSDPAGVTSVDHGAWSGFLEKYVVSDDPAGINLVTYSAVTPADKRNLDNYITSLTAVVVTGLTREEQLAYWINLYNALTVMVILEHYPVDSIREIKLSGGLFTRGPWRAKLLEIQGEAVSLDDIEHRILRPIWQDPRIHYAVNCASNGCPNLLPEAFTATNADELLDRGAREYISHPRGVSLAGGRLTLSSIYDWFSEDFGGEQGVLDHIASFADPDVAGQLRGYDGRIRYGYDWSLNDAR